MFGFRADPPTTTSQRLNALMTGSMPTFVEFGSNLNANTIEEDNFISILKEFMPSRERFEPTLWGQSIVFNFSSRLIVIGDDTWGRLFPDQFDEYYLYPSFNTKVS